MKRGDFYYELPESLIAHYPPENRGDSRLLSLDGDTGSLRDLQFNDLVSLLRVEDLMVFNDTRVLPARLYGNKDSGGKVEILMERILDNGMMLAQIKASKSPRTGSGIILGNGTVLEVLGKEDGLYRLQAGDAEDLLNSLDEIGHMPLPPYIRRPDEVLDKERYQTVYARHKGAVAAPTAGLHFSQAMMNRLKDAEVNTAFVTLHVGAGTFQPVRSENLADHRMHKEQFRISGELCSAIERTWETGGRIIAVGTTTVRSLEAAVRGKGLVPQQAETDIFIYPGFEFQVVDALITNFHLPESSLLMLICAFAGKDSVLGAYHHAVKEKYRFFSYGDAMFVTRAKD